MTLLATVFAAVICTAIWYKRAPDSKMMVSVLCWIYWGASIMWLVDAIFELAEEGSAYFTQEPAEMLDDLFLGLSVIALGLVVWVIVLLVKDPKGIFRRTSKGRSTSHKSVETNVSNISSVTDAEEVDRHK